MRAALPRSFYLRDTVTVARDLIGCELVCISAAGEASGLIVETEAYLGRHDPASHAFGGRRSRRTEVLYGPGGHAYIYLIYGLHLCLNLTTGPGRLCQALGIGLELNGTDLTEGPLLVLPRQMLTEEEIVSAARIGIGYAAAAQQWPLRFFLRDSPFISRQAKGAATGRLGR